MAKQRDKAQGEAEKATPSVVGATFPAFDATPAAEKAIIWDKTPIVEATSVEKKATTPAVEVPLLQA